MLAEPRSVAVIIAFLLVLPGVFAIGASAQDAGNNTTGPNTGWENATSIDIGTQINETTDGGAENWYQFEAGTDGNITVNVTAQEESQLAVFLYEGSESLDRGFVTPGNATVLQAPANASENYFFYVRNQRNETGDYSFMVEAPELETETPSSTTAATTSALATSTTADAAATSTATAETSAPTVDTTATESTSTNRTTLQRGLGDGENESNTTNATPRQTSATTNSSSGDSGSGSLLQGIIGPAIAIICLLGGTMVLFLVILQQ